MARSPTIRVEGLRELDRALGKMSKELRKELRSGMREAAEIVATEARSRATAQGLVRTGRLVRGIKPGVRGGGAIVRSTATQRGFNYARRHEFEGGGRRAYLMPAADAKRDAARDAADKVIAKLGGEAGLL